MRTQRTSSVESRYKLLYNIILYCPDRMLYFTPPSVRQYWRASTTMHAVRGRRVRSRNAAISRYFQLLYYFWADYIYIYIYRILILERIIINYNYRRRRRGTRIVINNIGHIILLHRPVNACHVCDDRRPHGSRCCVIVSVVLLLYGPGRCREYNAFCPQRITELYIYYNCI